MFVGTVKYEKNVKHFYSSTEKAFLWSMWYTAHNVVVDKILPLDLKASGFCTRQSVADKKEETTVWWYNYPLPFFFCIHELDQTCTTFSRSNIFHQTVWNAIMVQQSSKKLQKINHEILSIRSLIDDKAIKYQIY